MKYNVKEMNKQQLIEVIESNFNIPDEDLFKEAEQEKIRVYGDRVFFRGLIEFTNICKNNCYYCGISCQNKEVKRYRLSQEQILECCHTGYELGFRTFVLQGGEDSFFSDDIMCNIISAIKEQHGDCALTISIGEKSYEAYKRFYEAGADRYLLRHETANNELYEKLHPKELSLGNRKECLYNLKEIGFQVGAGFMVGSPYQQIEHLAEDLIFLNELQPQMVGIGPFIPHEQTKFKDFKAGTLNQTLVMVALTRLLLPNALLPATTALGTICENGRELGIKSGANVVMPNLSPKKNRTQYALYNNKISTGDEAAESVRSLTTRLEKIGVIADFSRGDHIEWCENKY